MTKFNQHFFPGAQVNHITSAVLLPHGKFKREIFCRVENQHYIFDEMWKDPEKFRNIKIGDYIDVEVYINGLPNYENKMCIKRIKKTNSKTP